MNIYSKRGTKVIFSNPNGGYEPDHKTAKKYLTLDKTYTVNYTVVHGYMTEVYLIEFPNIKFDSSQFK